ncbi:transposase [Corallococcus terminator]|uniref:Transposase n=1 Tax=Corallococcus terminator TaxID=2316733 RepID=A0A3A8IXC0_9BACT|nr:transposase [Corallococcus terminator]RKG87865.1 hypothetical protein D7V88_15220 [Corallococcus terminator]
MARKYGVNSSQVFRWRQLKEAGSVSGLKAGEAVVPEAEMRQLKAQVRELQRLLGKKTQEVDVLRDAMALACEKTSLIRARPSAHRSGGARWGARMHGMTGQVGIQPTHWPRFF